MSYQEIENEFADVESTINGVTYMCEGTICFSYQPGEPVRQPTHLDDDGDPGSPDEFGDWNVIVDSVSWEDENDVEQTDINESPIDAIKADLIEHFKAKDSGELVG